MIELSCGLSQGRLSLLQVIVIPIFWNRKPEEKEQVIAAAEKIVKLLQTLGSEIGIDTTVAMSPGQKYAYWQVTPLKMTSAPPAAVTNMSRKNDLVLNRHTSLQERYAFHYLRLCHLCRQSCCTVMPQLCFN